MPDLESVRAWGLVLDSQGIPNWIQPSDDGDWILVVAPPNADAAAAALRAYAEENAPPAVIETGAARYGRTWVAVALAVALAAFHGVTGPWDVASPWFRAGEADSGRILAGETWRVVTALTLHADGLHVASNALALALFGSALLSDVGPGLGLWLVLLSGVLGNLANAAMHGPGHGGVGASTAVFGIVGVLAALQAVRRRRRARLGSVWTPLFAGLLLLMLLGSGEQTDILAHLWGFVAGLGIGAATGRVVTVPPGRVTQWVLLGAGLAAVVGCWWLALR
jgi:rhomboid protease GluP